MKKLLLIVVAALFATSCSDASLARRVLTEQGYSQIEITGYDWLMCGKDDDFSTGFKAVSPTGARVQGAVCSALWTKGATIRFK